VYREPRAALGGACVLAGGGGGGCDKDLQTLNSQHRSNLQHIHGVVASTITRIRPMVIKKWRTRENTALARISFWVTTAL
jgi:hypothetical protein